MYQMMNLRVLNYLIQVFLFLFNKCFKFIFVSIVVDLTPDLRNKTDFSRGHLVNSYYEKSIITLVAELIYYNIIFYF